MQVNKMINVTGLLEIQLIDLEDMFFFSYFLYVSISLIILCEMFEMQGPGIEPFKNDREMEKHYADALHMGTINIVDDAAVEVEMEAALKEYDQIGSDLGSIPTSCKSLAEDPSWLTRWIIGEEKVQRV